MGFDSSSTFAISAYIWLICIFPLFYAVFEQHKTNRRGPMFILMCITASWIFRTIWFFFHYDQNASLPLLSATNRLALCLQLSGISLLVLIWAKGVTEFSLHSRLNSYCIWFNVVVYIVMLVTGVVLYDNERAYFINIMFICFISLVSVALVFTYSLSLRIKLTAVQSKELEAVVKKLIHVSAILCSCFFIRAVLFSYSPITGKDRFAQEWLNLVLYPFFFYQVPEFVPAVVIVLSIAPRVSIFRQKDALFDTESNVHEHEVLIRSIENPVHNLDYEDSSFRPELDYESDSVRHGNYGQQGGGTYFSSNGMSALSFSSSREGGYRSDRTTSIEV